MHIGEHRLREVGLANLRVREKVGDDASMMMVVVGTDVDDAVAGVDNLVSCSGYNDM